MKLANSFLMFLDITFIFPLITVLLLFHFHLCSLQILGVSFISLSFTLIFVSCSFHFPYIFFSAFHLQLFSISLPCSSIILLFPFTLLSFSLRLPVFLVSSLHFSYYPFIFLSCPFVSISYPSAFLFIFL